MVPPGSLRGFFMQPRSGSAGDADAGGKLALKSTAQNGNDDRQKQRCRLFATETALQGKIYYQQCKYITKAKTPYRPNKRPLQRFLFFVFVQRKTGTKKPARIAPGGVLLFSNKCRKDHNRKKQNEKQGHLPTPPLRPCGKSKASIQQRTEKSNSAADHQENIHV